MTIKDLQLPLSDYKIGKIGQFYTKEEVDQLIKYAVNEANVLMMSRCVSIIERQP